MSNSLRPHQWGKHAMSDADRTWLHRSDIDIRTLLSRIEAGAEADREIDLQVAAAVGFFERYARGMGTDPAFVGVAFKEGRFDDRERIDIRVGRDGSGRGGILYSDDLPRFTDDLTAAYRLLEADASLPRTGITLAFEAPRGVSATATVGDVAVRGRTPAAALCAAALAAISGTGIHPADLPELGSEWVARDGRRVRVDAWFRPKNYPATDYSAELSVLNREPGQHGTTTAKRSAFGRFYKPAPAVQATKPRRKRAA